MFNNDASRFEIAIACITASVALGKNPWPSALALLVLLAWRLADKYFHDSAHDENKSTLTQLKADFALLKAKQDRQELKGAFVAKQ